MARFAFPWTAQMQKINNFFAIAGRLANEASDGLDLSAIDSLISQAAPLTN